MWLTLDHVTKLYGPVIGVNDISCRIGPGITGLFGANGAGKSTLMKLASGQLRPTQGSVLIGDLPAWSSRAKRHLGFSPDVNSFYEEMTGREFVLAMTRLYGYSLREARRRTERALEDVAMTDRADRHLGGCSHGMRQRIKLAQALANDPQVLLLDEPMTGIDPGGRRDLSRLLVRQAEAGRTVLVSSHILSEVEQLTDSIIMIARGRMIASGTIAEIRRLLEKQPYTVQLVARGHARDLASRLVQIPEVESVEVRHETLTVRTRHPQQFFGMVGEIVLERGLELERLETLDAGADAVFGYLERE